MKLYTKTGDDGTTSLFGGQRVPKDALRVEAYGQVDELNAAIGWASTACTHDSLGGYLTRIQNELFQVGAVLCTPPDSHSKHIQPLTDQHVQWQEAAIDACCEPLPPLKNFILPGGCELAARLHLARCICRRAERATITLSTHEPVGEHIIEYLNRLSDLLFAMARRANQLHDVQDVIWHG